jgi:hypothetical protein
MKPTERPFKIHFMPLSKAENNFCRTRANEKKLRVGAALFIALAFLSLFSMLGATYLRYMSLELEGNTRSVYSVRARHYAIAGLESALGQIHNNYRQGEAPALSQVFSYRVYGGEPGATHETPIPIETHVAEAAVTLSAMDAESWSARFQSAPAWPGTGKAYRVISSSEIKRASTGEMRVLGKYSVESIITVEENGCRVISFGTFKP